MNPSMPDDTAGWPPEDTIFAIDGVDIAVLPGPHPFHAEQSQAAADNWEREIAANPALFDGQMVFLRQLQLRDGVLQAAAHMVPFSTFMWWRRQPGGAGGIHLFGWAILISSDNAIIAIRMGAQTANPGQVYCAAGSLDAHDVIDGRCDLEGNMVREVREETGLDLAQARPVSGLHALHRDRRFTVFRFFRFERTAAALLADIAAHMQVDEEKEIDGAVAIRSADPGAHAYNPMMLPILDLFFSGRPL